MEILGHWIPLEVIEKILTHLDGHDLVNCRNVCKLWDGITQSDNFWKMKCFEIGYGNRDKEIFTSDTKAESWRELFWCDYNWRNNRGVYKDFSLEEGNDENTIIQLYQSLFFVATNDKILIWNIDKYPRIEQGLEVIPNKNKSVLYLGVSEYHIAYVKNELIHIYSNNDSSKYSLVKVIYVGCSPLVTGNEKLPKSPFQEFTDFTSASHLVKIIPIMYVSEMALNNDKLALAVVNLKESYSRCDIVYIFCLSTWTFYNVMLPRGCDSIDLLWPKLYVFQNFQGMNSVPCNIMNVFDVPKNAWNFKIIQPFSRFDSYKYSISECFLVASSLINGNSEVLFNVWTNVNGRCIFSFQRECDIDRIQINHKTIILDKLILMIMEKNVFLTDPVKGVLLKELCLDRSDGLIHAINRYYISFFRRGELEIWDMDKGKRLYSVTLCLYESWYENENCERHPIQNTHYFCFPTRFTWVDMIAILDYKAGKQNAELTRCRQPIYEDFDYEWK